MPEILTKHPDIVKQILNESGVAKCGEGLPQQILKRCPRQNFCQLKTGELCIYGLNEANKMTQFKPKDIRSDSGYAYCIGLTIILLTLFIKKKIH